MQLASEALQGIKVLDLTHYIAGPYCTKLLADFGADVIKIERPGGDPARNMAPFYHDERNLDNSLIFFYLNTSKQGMTLDLKSPEGQEIFRKLVSQCDAVIENYSPRVMPSLGLDFDSLKKINPSLVMISISNFGQTGPYRDYKATDIVEYALGGLMYIFGAYAREPLKHAYNQAQFKAGTNAASAALIALFNSRKTAQGQHVDLSIQESISTALRDVTSNFTYTGAVRRRQPNHSGDLTRLREVSDGYILPNPGMSAGLDWNKVVEFLESASLDDDKFRTGTARLENAEELGSILDKLFSTKTKLDMFYAAHEQRFIYGVIDSPSEVLDNPQNQYRNRFINLDHPSGGLITFPGAPFKMSRTPADGLKPPPKLGEHNKSVLSERLGYTDDTIKKLISSGVI